MLKLPTGPPSKNTVVAGAIHETMHCSLSISKLQTANVTLPPVVSVTLRLSVKSLKVMVAARALVGRRSKRLRETITALLMEDEHLGAFMTIHS
jgi:hypothetical protein